ncbi:Bug family tripartite tricarboxylate transporter substrate binding protein [Cupriavidus sp. 2MCAB6]|uniref:Bug family tripartite tricarboxylate transporter substrate binding protein n=1 Tax=Cupriavidus TaxID=106589 RepID=UPI0023E8E50F|nr:tripartite tricarboxylate transporter substrate binding protein [Cupriavidus basilensis]MDF3881321.1 tripartite tricarboxylate transporter substrate binding protein [Cupriavidus basilensis]
MNRPNPRRRALSRLSIPALAIAAGMLGSPIARAAAATDWPQPGKPVRVVVPFTAGSGGDALLRLIAKRASEQSGANIIIDNKPGAGTFIGAQDVARAPADGHTLLYTIVVTHTQNPHLYSKLPYDPFKDFTPVVQLVRSATVLVANRNAPFGNVRELVAYAKQHPGELNFASYSLGSTSHLNGEILQQRAGIQMVHVPYKGTADATRAVLAGDVQVYFDGTATAVENARAGKVKLLGVAADKRLAVLPELPTMAEQGVEGLDIVGWQGLFGPGNLPAPVAQKIADTFRAAAQAPDIAEMIRAQGNDLSGAGPDAFRKIVAQDYDRWGAVIKRIGLKLD